MAKDGADGYGLRYKFVIKFTNTIKPCRRELQDSDGYLVFSCCYL